MENIDTYLESQVDKKQERTEDQKRMERWAEERERQIVRFTNIDNESFTHSFRGISITIKQGESYIGRLPECEHLAFHLARKIIAREKKKKLGLYVSGMLYTDEEVNELKGKILTQIDKQEPERFSQEELRKRDVEQLQKIYNPQKEINVTKEEVIKDLQSRGLKVDTNKSKKELLEQLLEAEQMGIQPKE